MNENISKDISIKKIYDIMKVNQTKKKFLCQGHKVPNINKNKITKMSNNQIKIFMRISF